MPKGSKNLKILIYQKMIDIIVENLTNSEECLEIYRGDSWEQNTCTI